MSERRFRLRGCAWAVVAASAFTVAGCAADGTVLPTFAKGQQASEVIGVSPLQYWWQAEKADAAERERLWQDAQQRGSKWRLALLQSLPGSSRYDIDAARKRLRAVAASGSSADVTALAQLRLMQLKDQDQSQTRLKLLQRRLDEVVAIERKMDGQ